MSTPQYIPPTFDEIIEIAVSHTLENGYHIPTVIAAGTRNAVPMIGDFPDDGELRHALMYFLGRQAARQPIGQLKDVYTIMEAWLGGQANPDGSMRVRPTDDPNRIEILGCSHYNLRTSHLDLVAFEFIRDTDGTLIDLVKIQDSRDFENADAKSHLIEAFMDGYHDERRGRLPRHPSGGWG
jgi:hypothetical protein